MTVLNTKPLLLNQLSTSPPGKTGWPWDADGRRPQPYSPTAELWPKITIVTPSYNQGSFLEQTIRSVLLQGYPNLEYLLVDGGSTDQSISIIKKYEPWLDWWVSEKDSGQSNAINKGFRRASGTILGWLNSDDFLLPGALVSIASLYRNHPEAKVYVGGGQFVDPEGNVIDVKMPALDLTQKSLFNWLDDFHFMQPSCFFSCEAWEQCGPLAENLHFAMDLDLWLKFAVIFRFVRTDSLLSCSRIHRAAKTTGFADMSLVDSCLVLARHGGEQQARKHLELMAAKLRWNEYYVTKITQSIFFRLFRTPIRWITKSDKKWKDCLPPWHSEKVK